MRTISTAVSTASTGGSSPLVTDVAWSGAAKVRDVLRVEILIREIHRSGSRLSQAWVVEQQTLTSTTRCGKPPPYGYWPGNGPATTDSGSIT